MPIEYSPPGLESILNSPLAEKRLKNREGQAHCQNCGWCVESGPAGNGIIDIHTAATEHQIKYPNHLIRLSEDNCGTISIGGSLRPRA